MNISELSIRRPVLATVLTIIILLFGMIGYNTLGVREYPSVDNPIISVQCSYPGANADVIENQITEPLEQSTLPYRVQQMLVSSGSMVLDFATITFSIIALEVPMALTG